MKFLIILRVFILFFVCYARIINLRNSQERKLDTLEYNKIVRTPTIFKMFQGLLIDNNVWNNFLKTQTIIFQKKTRDLNDVKSEYNNNKSNHTNVSTILKKVSTQIYLLLNCKYSELIIDLLKYFLEIISYCETSEQNLKQCLNAVNDYIIKKKTIFEKVIFSLFIVLDTFSNLKFASQVLLKSITSINLFMCYHKNSKKENLFYTTMPFNINDEKKIYAQMINNIEVFRCQKCDVFKKYYDISKKYEINNEFFDQTTYDFSKFEENSNIKKKIEDFECFFKEIYAINFNNTKSPIFYEDMYDTKNLILGYIFDNEENGYFSIKKISVLVKRKTSMILNDEYKNALNCYNINTIFEYQMLFMGVITDLFYLKYIQINDNQSCSEYGCYLDLIQLVNKFIAFKDHILPHNYPKNYLILMDQLSKQILTDIADNHRNNNSKILKEDTITTQKILESITTINKESYNIGIELKLCNLIDDIINNNYLNSFRRVFELFLSESNTLEEFNMYNGDKNKNKIVNLKTRCTFYSQMRNNLVIFHILLINKLNKPPASNNEVFSEAMEHINKDTSYLLYWYRSEYDMNVEQILEPISNRFNEAIKRKDLNEFEMLLLAQQSLLTSNLIENYEINNCENVKFSRKMYVDINDKVIFDTNKNLINENEIFQYIKPFPINKIVVKKLKSLELFIKRFLTDKNRGQINSNKINWDGTERTVNDIVTILEHDIISFNHIVRLQLFIIEWLFYNILKKMLYMSTCKIVQNQEKHTENNEKREEITFLTINDDLLKIQNLPFSESIKQYFSQIITVFLKINSDQELNNEVQIRDRATTLKEHMTYLNTNIINVIDDEIMTNKGNNNCKSISLVEIHNELENDYNSLSVMLNPYPKEKKINFITLYKINFFYVY